MFATKWRSRQIPISGFLDNGGVHIGERDLIQINPRNPVYYGYLHDLDGAVIEVEEVDIAALKLETPPDNNYRIRHVSLATPNLKRLIAFYSVLFDEPDPRAYISDTGYAREGTDGVSGLPGSKLNMAWFQVRNLELEMFQYVSHPTELPKTPRPVDAIGYNMIVFDVDDINAAVTKLKDAGGTVVTEPQIMDGGSIVFGRDPDGNLLGFQNVPNDSVVSSQNFIGNGT